MTKPYTVSGQDLNSGPLCLEASAPLTKLTGPEKQTIILYFVGLDYHSLTIQNIILKNWNTPIRALIELLSGVHNSFLRSHYVALLPRSAESFSKQHESCSIWPCSLYLYHCHMFILYLFHPIINISSNYNLHNFKATLYKLNKLAYLCNFQ